MAEERSPAPGVVVDGISERGDQGGLGPALRRAWVGYQLRVDEEMDRAGFSDRRLPDGRVLRLCSDPAGTTISGIGRELDITRQGAAKVVARLRDGGFLSVADSATSGREKSVTVTRRGTEYLEAQRNATRAIDNRLRAELGAAGLSALNSLLDALGRGEELRMRTYLDRSRS